MTRQSNEAAQDAFDALYKQLLEPTFFHGFNAGVEYANECLRQIQAHVEGRLSYLQEMGYIENNAENAMREAWRISLSEIKDICDKSADK